MTAWRVSCYHWSFFSVRSSVQSGLLHFAELEQAVCPLYHFSIFLYFVLCHQQILVAPFTLKATMQSQIICCSTPYIHPQDFSLISKTSAVTSISLPLNTFLCSVLGEHFSYDHCARGRVYYGQVASPSVLQISSKKFFAEGKIPSRFSYCAMIFSFLLLFIWFVGYCNRKMAWGLFILANQVLLQILSILKDHYFIYFSKSRFTKSK